MTVLITTLLSFCTRRRLYASMASVFGVGVEMSVVTFWNRSSTVQLPCGPTPPLHTLLAIPRGGGVGESGETSIPRGRAGWLLVPTCPGVPALGTLMALVMPDGLL